MNNHVHISGLNVVIITASAIVGLGTLSFVAQRYAPNSKFWTSYLALMSPTLPHA